MPNKITLSDVSKSIRNVPDFPKKGIVFKDLTTAFKSKEVFNFMVDEIYSYYKNFNITKVVGIESRGFILGSALAYKLHAGLVLIRKPGKLPANTYSKTYSLEYGEDSLEIHKDALSTSDIVLLHDDLLATGGTILASLDLIKKFNVKDIKINFICELSFLNGRKKFEEEYEVFSLIKFWNKNITS